MNTYSTLWVNKCMVKCYSAVKNETLMWAVQRGQTLETVRLSEDRLRGMCDLWLHFHFMSTTGKFTETKSRSVGMREVTTNSFRIDWHSIPQPCKANATQWKDWILHSVIFLFIWKTLKSCKWNKRYDSISKHMVPNRYPELAFLPTSHVDNCKLLSI